MSLVALINGHPGLEVVMVGREGMAGVELAACSCYAKDRRFYTVNLSQ